MWIVKHHCNCEASKKHMYSKHTTSLQSAKILIWPIKICNHLKVQHHYKDAWFDLSRCAITQRIGCKNSNKFKFEIWHAGRVHRLVWGNLWVGYMGGLRVGCGLIIWAHSSGYIDSHDPQLTRTHDMHGYGLVDP